MNQRNHNSTMQSTPGTTTPMPAKRTVSLILAIVLLIVGLGAGIGVGYYGLPARSTGNLCSSGNTITIGELLDLSSQLSSQGVRAKDSSILAINDINAMLSASGCTLRFANTVDDYALNNQQAQTDLTSFHSSGIQVVVGPLNSGTAQYILQYANTNHIVLISPSSTSAALAIPNDYLFRTAPNDAAQGQADARMMVDRGAKALIIVQRHDTYGDGLANATSTWFKNDVSGATVDTIQYDTSTTDFTTVITAMQNDFNALNSGSNTNKVAMDFVSFEEFGQMILQAHTSSYPSFPWTSLPWFGTDGEAQDAVIVNATTSGPSVAQVILPSTVYAPVNNSRTLAFYTRFANAYPGNYCDSYCLGAYDDVWLGANAILQAGANDGTAVQAVLSTVADNFYGVTGWMGLQPSGDRIPSSYQIWKVVNQGSPMKPTWVLAGSWDDATDTVTWTNPP